VTYLQMYERLAPDAHACWTTLACDLTDEAARHVGDQRQKRLDRAAECLERAAKAVRL
jgi:hypothetical protein